MTLTCIDLPLLHPSYERLSIDAQVTGHPGDVSHLLRKSNGFGEPPSFVSSFCLQHECYQKMRPSNRGMVTSRSLELGLPQEAQLLLCEARRGQRKQMPRFEGHVQNILLYRASNSSTRMWSV